MIALPAAANEAVAEANRVIINIACWKNEFLDQFNLLLSHPCAPSPSYNYYRWFRGGGAVVASLAASNEAMAAPDVQIRQPGLRDGRRLRKREREWYWRCRRISRCVWMWGVEWKRFEGHRPSVGGDTSCRVIVRWVAMVVSCVLWGRRLPKSRTPALQEQTLGM
jgi:hypothetical protein